jgi:uncharacterized protein YuzE
MYGFTSPHSKSIIRSNASIASPQHVAEGIAVDYAADGRIAGIEILDGRKRFGDPEVFRRVILEDIALAAPPVANQS